MEGGASEMVAAATLFAAVVTKLVDLVRNILEPVAPKLPKATWNLVAFGLGIGVALIWKINLLDNFGADGINGVSGQLVTGLAIAGAGSGYHELFDTLSSHAKKAKATALVADTEAVKEGAVSLGVRGAESAVERPGGPAPASASTTPPTA